MNDTLRYIWNAFALIGIYAFIRFMYFAIKLLYTNNFFTTYDLIFVGVIGFIIFLGLLIWSAN